MYNNFKHIYFIIALIFNLISKKNLKNNKQKNHVNSIHIVCVLRKQNNKITKKNINF